MPKSTSKMAQCLTLKNIMLAFIAITLSMTINNLAADELEHSDSEHEQAGADGKSDDLTNESAIPKLTHQEEMILHALLGGLGPVIIPNDDISRQSPGGDHDDNENSRKSRGRMIREKPEDREPPQPEQVHIAYGDDPSKMVIMWSTPSKGSSEVVYGATSDNLNLTASGNYSEFMDLDGDFEGKPFIHRVILENLTPGSHYFYRVKSNDELSKVFSFIAMRNGTDWSPTLLVYGDMGRKGGAPTLRLLKKAARERSADAVLHVGDFAYDFHDEAGLVGDDFMNRIQDIAANLPYMTCPGNHEIPHSFVHYKYRFSMPGARWPEEDEMWYSFNMGNVHFVSYSTEVYFTKGPIDAQIAWLRKDLARANEERTIRPWIIVFGHRPMYCSNNNNDDCTNSDSRIKIGLEDLFFDNGVDLIIEAHEHSYERFWPMHRGHVTAKSYENPTAPVHIISGAAGCNDFDGLCLDPILAPRGEWSAFRSWLPGLYGYGRLHVANATHLHFQQRLALNDQVLDEFWIQQNNHGHFPPQD